MKKLFAILLLSTIAHAQEFGGAGNYDGELFTGAGYHNPISIQAGEYKACESVGSDMYRCDVTNGRIEIQTNRGPETFTLTRVVVLSSESVGTATEPSVPTEHHYFRASRSLKFGEKDVAQAANVTVNWYSNKKDRVFGFIELTELGARSSFEAYRKY